MKNPYKKLIVLGVITLVIAGYFNFAYLKNRHTDFQHFYIQHRPGTVVSAYWAGPGKYPDSTFWQSLSVSLIGVSI